MVEGGITSLSNPHQTLGDNKYNKVLVLLANLATDFSIISAILARCGDLAVILA
jgi:hypothetical protein